MSNKSGLEIERRFLLKVIPQNTKEYHVGSINIFQVYLPNDGETIRRIREESPMSGPDEENVYTYTEKKYVSPGVREENEKDITREEFDELLAEEGTKTYIAKNRHKFKFPETGDLIWEIDMFQNINLVIAEVELPSLSIPLELPACLKNDIIMEVTNILELSNSSLATVLKL